MLSNQLIVPIAHGATVETVRPLLSYSLRYDDNVFGVASRVSSTPTGGYKHSGDFSHTVGAGVLVDAKLGRQYLTGSFIVNRTRYDTYKLLNIDGRELQTNLKWSIGNHFDGNMGFVYSKGLTPFIEVDQLTSNSRTQQRHYLDAGWRFHPAWRLRALASSHRLEYEGLSSEQIDSRRDNRFEMGMEYLARSGSKVSLLYAHTSGTAATDLRPAGVWYAGGYGQDEVKVSVDWLFSGKTRFQLLAGPVWRHQDDPRMKDANGINARASAVWEATGKLNLVGALWRDTGIADGTSGNVFSINSGTSIAARWQLSQKVLLDLQAKYERRDFGQVIGASLPDGQDRYQKVRTLSLGATYRPLRNLSVQSSLFHIRKDAGPGSGVIAKNGMSITVQQVF